MNAAMTAILDGLADNVRSCTPFAIEAGLRDASKAITTLVATLAERDAEVAGLKADVATLRESVRAGQPTPAPAAKQQKCKHPMVMDIPDNKQRCVDCGFVMDRPFIPPQPAPPPADVVLREDVLAMLDQQERHVDLSPGIGEDIQRYSRLLIEDIRCNLNCLSSPAPDVRSEAELEMWKRCREAVDSVVSPVWTQRDQAKIDCLAAIDSCKPTAPVGTGGEGTKE